MKDTFVNRLMDSWMVNGIQSPAKDIKAIRGQNIEREMARLMER
jgi:hypothetical protein